MKITAMTGEIWLGEWVMWLMVVQVSFLKCDVLSQFRDRYSKVLLSQLMTSSFKGNKLYSLPFRFAEQKARLRGKLSVFFLQQAHRKSSTTYCCFSSSIEWAVEVHYTVTQSFFFSACLIGTYGLAKMFHHLKLNEMVILGKSPCRQKCLEKKVQSGNETMNGSYLQASISGASTMPSCLSTDIFLGSLPNGQHFLGIWFPRTSGLIWTQDALNSDLGFKTQENVQCMETSENRNRLKGWWNSTE